MLVYANSFLLSHEVGLEVVVAQVALWVGTTRKSYVDPIRLAEGIRELRFSDGALLNSMATLDEQGNRVFPFYFCAKLLHGQPGVPGRRWATEIGLKQESPDQEVHCSVLLKTDEISAKVNEPIQVTRPRIVELIVKNCKPAHHVPGLNVIQLTEENAGAFGYEIEREGRRYPIILVSCDYNGRYPVGIERLRAILVGLAQVVEIPVNSNTYQLEKVLGRKYSAFGGAINVISYYRPTDYGGFCKTTLLKPDQIADMLEDGLSLETEILALVTHQTNLPHSWKHISSESVREAMLRSRLRRATMAAPSSPDSAAYEALLQEASEQLASKDRELDGARSDLDAREANLDRLAAENEGLKYSLSQLKPKAEVAKPEMPVLLMEALRAALRGSPSLEQALAVVDALYPGRLEILETAYASAKESDRAGFQFGAKALEMLETLARDYWQDLFDGKGDQQAKNRFGKKDFAAKEADSLSEAGKRRRTFRYRDRTRLMEKHIKLGVKDSPAETLRVHFDWFPDDKLIVIGHCGKHLDF